MKTKLKPEFEWFENDMTCGDIFLVRLDEVPPTEDDIGHYMLKSPVLCEALVETGIQIGLKEWRQTPLRLNAEYDAKAMAEKLYAALFRRLEFTSDATGVMNGKNLLMECSNNHITLSVLGEFLESYGYLWHQCYVEGRIRKSVMESAKRNVARYIQRFGWKIRYGKMQYEIVTCSRLIMRSDYDDI